MTTNQPITFGVHASYITILYIPQGRNKKLKGPMLLSLAMVCETNYLDAPLSFFTGILSLNK
jgi:hypothetical protein